MTFFFFSALDVTPLPSGLWSSDEQSFLISIFVPLYKMNLFFLHYLQELVFIFDFEKFDYHVSMFWGFVQLGFFWGGCIRILLGVPCVS